MHWYIHIVLQLCLSVNFKSHDLLLPSHGQNKLGGGTNVGPLSAVLVSGPGWLVLWPMTKSDMPIQIWNPSGRFGQTVCSYKRNHKYRNVLPRFPKI